jgi:hypothetical protein
MKMNPENSQLFKEFEKEVWLYLDGDLSEDRMNYWQNKLTELPELNKIIDDYRSVSESYDMVKEKDIGADTFNEMIDKTIGKKSFGTLTINFLEKLFNNNSEFAFGKIAFASALIIAAVLISLLSNKPNPVVNITNSINAELLDWDPDFVDSQINKVGTLLKVARDDDYRKYYKYKLGTTNVDKNLNLINSNIEALKKEINDKEL